MATPSDQPADETFSLAELDELFFDALEQRGHARLADIAQYPTHDAGVDETLDRAFENSARRLASLAEDVNTAPTLESLSAADALAPHRGEPATIDESMRVTTTTSTATAPASTPAQIPARQPEMPTVATAPRSTPSGRRDEPIPIGDLVFGGSTAPVPGSQAYRPPPGAVAGGREAAYRPARDPLAIGAGIIGLLAVIFLAFLAFLVVRLLSGPDAVDSASATAEVSRCGPTSVAGQVANFEAESRLLMVEVTMKQDGRELPAVQHLVAVDAGSSVTLAIAVPGALDDPAGDTAAECTARVVSSAPADQSG